jgi:hypothetical protein
VAVLEVNHESNLVNALWKLSVPFLNINCDAAWPHQTSGLLSIANYYVGSWCRICAGQSSRDWHKQRALIIYLTELEMVGPAYLHTKVSWRSSAQIRSIDSALEVIANPKHNSIKRQGAMRTLEESRKRWSVCFSDENFGVDLRQTVRDLESKPSPCADGLRSVCWKVCHGPRWSIQLPL